MDAPVLYRCIYDNKTISRFGFSRSSRFYHFLLINPKEHVHPSVSQVQIHRNTHDPATRGCTRIYNVRIELPYYHGYKMCPF